MMFEEINYQTKIYKFRIDTKYAANKNYTRIYGVYFCIAVFMANTLLVENKDFTNTKYLYEYRSTIAKLQKI